MERGRGRGPRRLRHGTIILRAIRRVDPVVNNAQGPLRRRANHDVDDIVDAMGRLILWATTPFVRAGMNVDPLPMDRVLGDARVPFEQFKDGVLAAGATEVMLRHHHVIVTQRGSWFDQIICFKSQINKTGAIRMGGGEVNFLRQSTTTVPQAARDIQFYMDNYVLPIALLMTDGFESCVVLVLYRKPAEFMQQRGRGIGQARRRNQEWACIMKGTLPLAETHVPSLARMLMRSLHFRRVRVVGELDGETEINDACSFKGGLIACGSVMEAQFPEALIRLAPNLYKVFDVVINRYEFP